MSFVRTWVYYLLYIPVRLVFFLANPVFRVTGREHIPEGPFILCCNHSHWSDPFFVLFATRPRRVYRFLAKIELSRVPVIAGILRGFGVVFVDRGHHDTAALELAREDIRGGDQMMIFPEGTRVKPGQEVSAKVGAIQLAQECGVPILPMYLSRDRRLLRPVRAVIGEAYEPIPDHQPRDREEMKLLAAELKAIIYGLGEKECR